MKSEYRIESQRRHVRMTYRRRQAKKVCVRCGGEKETLPARANCNKCTEYKNAYMKKWRLEKSIGEEKHAT